MEEIRELLPEDCREEWDEITNFNPATVLNLDPEVFRQIAEWKDHRMQPLFSSEPVQYAYEEWTPREGDVFISAFPKTGLNWTNEIVKKLLYSGQADNLKLVTHLPITMALLEGGSSKKFKVLDGLPLKRRIHSTHLPATLINVEKIKRSNAKVIYVLRNPKDQTVSWFRFIPSLPYLKPFGDLFSSDWNTFFENYTSGKMPLGMREGEWYPDHILSWVEHKDDKNVMFFYYEDMKKDLVKELTRMVKFLELDTSQENIETIARECEFSAMKKQTEQRTNPQEQYRDQLGILRKGQVGGWKEYFTVAQSERMDKIFEEKLGKTETRFRYL